MKKAIALLLCLSLVSAFGGCGEPSGTQVQSPGNFYYYRPEPAYGSENAVIAPEVHDLAGMRGDMDAILAAYLSGPVGRELESPFPRDTAVLAWTLTDDTFTIQFSGEFALLSGIDLTIACACVTQTILELTPASQVVITAGGELLDGETAITMSRDSLNLFDDSVDRLQSVYTVYYTDSQRRYLIGQEVAVNLATRGDLETYLIEQLLTPPAGSDLYSPLPEGTKLLDIRVEDGLCSVSFSAEFETNTFSRSDYQRLTLMSVVNTLTQLNSIDRVEFCIEGNLLLSYGLLSIAEPLEWDERVIGPVRTAVNEFDATLFLANGTEQLLTPVPTRIRQASGISQPELILRTLLNYESGNGLKTGIPKDTRLNSMTIADGVCAVDLSAEFLQSGEQVPLALRTITATLCALEEIEAVRVTIDGGIPQGDLAVWFGIMTPNSDWYL